MTAFRRMTWITLDLARPSAHAREVAGLMPHEARAALGLPPTAGGLSNVWSPELNERNGILPQLGKFLARCDAYGLDVQVRVRRRQ